MWSDSELKSIVTEDGTIDIEATFVVSDDGVAGTFMINHWQRRGNGFAPVGAIIEDELLADATAQYLIRIGRPHYRSVEEVVAVKRQMEGEAET